jgi:hypothetical protein
LTTASSRTQPTFVMTPFKALLPWVALLAVNAHAAPLVRLTVGSTHVSPEGRVTTGKKSYSELALAQGTLRVGSSTALTTRADEVQLEHGLALVAAKSKLFRPSVKVRTPRHELSVRGTAQVYQGTDGSLKVAVLEGRLTLALSSLTGESMTLRAGQAVVLKSVDQALPRALNIDLDRLMASAELVSGRQFEDLPTQELVDGASQRQAREVAAAETSSSANDKDDDTDSADDSGTDERIEEVSQADVGEEVDDLDGDGQDDANDPDFDDELDGEDDTEGEDTEGGDDGEGDDGAPGEGDDGDAPGDGEG